MRLTIALLLLMLLPACGQKGPLYLPKEQEPSAVVKNKEPPTALAAAIDARDK